MNSRKAVEERILHSCDQRRLALNALAHRAGVPPSTVKSIINGASKNPGIVTLKLLCDGLGISLFDFFNCESFRSLESEDVE